MHWIPVTEAMPTFAGEYLCFVEIPKSRHKVRPRPSHSRYMALLYSDGGFMIGNGRPKGMITHWMPLEPPSAFKNPVRVSPIDLGAAGDDPLRYVVNKTTTLKNYKHDNV